MLTSADTITVEIASILLADLRSAQEILPAITALMEGGNLEDETAEKLIVQMKRLRGMFSAGHYGQLTKCLGTLGMNPTDRSKIALPKAKSANPFANLS